MATTAQLRKEYNRKETLLASVEKAKSLIGVQRTLLLQADSQGDKELKSETLRKIEEVIKLLS